MTYVFAVLVGLLIGAGASWVALTSRHAASSARLRADLALAEQRLVDVRAEQLRQAEQFQALAADALQRNNESFLTLAGERFKASEQAQAAELGKRTTEVQQLVEPLRETLARVERTMGETDKQRAESHATLTEQVRAAALSTQQLQAETRQLVTALRAPQARGAWGELQLRRVVELAGMLEHCDFDTQVRTITADGVQQPDMVVHIAGGKDIVVDAKVSLAAFLDASQSDDVGTQNDRLQAHARHLRTHVDSLAAKAYWKQFPSAPELVVLFVPGESFLVHALGVDPGLQEYAMERHIVIATPSTLLTLLKTVGYAWRQEALAENARQVLEVGRELHDRLGRFGASMDKVGRAVTSVVTSYNAAVGTLEARVLPGARRLKELKVTAADIETPRSVEESVRPLTRSELVLAAEADAQLRIIDEAVEHELSDPRYGLDVAAPEPGADSLGA